MVWSPSFMCLFVLVFQGHPCRRLFQAAGHSGGSSGTPASSIDEDDISAVASAVAEAFAPHFQQQMEVFETAMDQTVSLIARVRIPSSSAPQSFLHLYVF